MLLKCVSKGNAVEFGNLFTHYAQGACSNSVRAIFAGGSNYPSPGYGLAIQSVTIASDGNAVDFGDMGYTTPSGIFGLSNAHGGL